MTTYNLSPSDLTFLWDECKRCFYLKVKHNIGYKGPFPGMFGRMGNLTSNYYLDKPSSELSPALPAGVVKYREKWVKSVPISFPELTAQCIIKGRFDAIMAFEDGSYGIIDYKTSDASEEKSCVLQPAIIRLCLRPGEPGSGCTLPIPDHPAGSFHHHTTPV
jgi:hypothetical protein